MASPLASVISAQARFGAEVRRVSAVDAGTHPVLVVVNPTALLAECADVTRVYRSTRAQLLVTCHALAPPAGTCRPMAHGTVLLTTPPRPGSVSLALAGVPLRGATRSS